MLYYNVILLQFFYYYLLLINVILAVFCLLDTLVASDVVFVSLPLKGTLKLLIWCSTKKCSLPCQMC